MRRPRRSTVALAVIAMAFASLSVPAASLAAGCHNTSAGMTAAIDIEGSPTTLSGTAVDATGCDIGIYVGHGADGTVLDGVTVSGANDHGVLVQDVADVVVRDSTITGNGVSIHTLPGTAIKLSEDKALTLLGTSDAVVENNRIVDNVGDGGISINDDGNWPSMSVLAPGLSRAAVGNVVRHNTVSGNLSGCAIVLSAFEPGRGVNDNLVVDNSVTGQKFSGVIGSIVVAADPPGASARNNMVLHNTVTYSLIPGIIVHSNAPGDAVSGTKIIHNTLIGNNWAKGADSVAGKSVGIAIASEAAGAPTPSVLTDTLVVHNTIIDDDYGIWTSHATGTRLVQNDFIDVGTDIVQD